MSSTSNYIYRPAQGTNDRTFYVDSSSDGNLGTVVLTIECTNQFTG